MPGPAVGALGGVGATLPVRGAWFEKEKHTRTTPSEFVELDCYSGGQLERAAKITRDSNVPVL
jgi:hypothetical protein